MMQYHMRSCNAIQYDIKYMLYIYCIYIYIYTTTTTTNNNNVISYGIRS